MSRCLLALALSCSLPLACSKGSAVPDEEPSSAGASGATQGGAVNAGGSTSAGTGGVTSAAGAGSSAGSATTTDAGALPDNEGPGAVFVHLFEWRWTDIALECETHLGPNGFAAVQVSPPSEHAVLANEPWWERYQTVGYSLEKSRSGTRAEFEDMVRRCRAAGVGIYVDAVINHMTGQASGTGSNGTSFTKYEYPGLYSATDFHQPTCTIQGADYASSAENVQSCELLGLADLDTGQSGVRQKIAGYLSDLLELGVRGFRIDAAKHMAPSDLDGILSLVDAGADEEPPYYFFEVIDYGGEAIHSTDYLDVGSAAGADVDITEFRYSRVSDAFLKKDAHTLSELQTLDSGLLEAARAVVFTNNHDTQRNGAISYRDGAAYELANVFMLAWPYGYPSIMSSYAFDPQTGRDQGPPASTVADAGCASSPATAPNGTWVCEHRTRSLVNMVAFRKATASAPEITHLWSNGANQLAFGRGSLGFVVINHESELFAQSLQTGLAAGTYCDIIASDHANGGCSSAVTVDAQGIASISLPAESALALYVGASP